MSEQNVESTATESNENRYKNTNDIQYRKDPKTGQHYIVFVRRDWATRMLMKEGEGKHLPRRIRDKAVAMLRGTGKFSQKKPTGTRGPTSK